MTNEPQPEKNFLTTFRNSPMQLLIGILLGSIISWVLVSNLYVAHLLESHDKQIETLESQLVEQENEYEQLSSENSRFYNDLNSTRNSLTKKTLLQKAKILLLEEIKKRQENKAKLEAELIENAFPDQGSEIVSPLEISSIAEMKVEIEKLRIEISDIENCMRLEMYPASPLPSYKCTELPDD